MLSKCIYMFSLKWWRILNILVQWDLNHCSLVMPYGDIDFSQHWLRNGLLPDGTKSLHVPMLTNHQIISGCLWHSPEGNFSGNAQDIYPWYEFEKYWFQVTAASPLGLCVKYDMTYNRLHPRFMQSIGGFCEHVIKRGICHHVLSWITINTDTCVLISLLILLQWIITKKKMTWQIFFEQILLSVILGSYKTTLAIFNSSRPTDAHMHQ